MYIGDGSIASPKPNHVFIRWTLDSIYPGIAEECRDAVQRATGLNAGIQARANERVLIVQASGTCWLDLFPQHGPVKKHLRKI